MAIAKGQRRRRRSGGFRRRAEKLQVTRLCVHRTPRHIYAQIISPQGGKVLASASTVESAIKKEIKNGGNIKAAAVIGKQIAERAKAAGVEKVTFDRSGFRYHGRLKVLADSAREQGLVF